MTEVASSGQSQSGLDISFSLAFETIPNKLEAQSSYLSRIAAKLREIKKSYNSTISDQGRET